jgi:hypothetical protein
MTLGEQVPKPEGNQVIFESMVVSVHPLRIQITEDFYNCLYGFAFPGQWTIGKSEGNREWQDDPYHNISVFDNQLNQVRKGRKQQV